jgi:hypothetical protein
MLVAANAAIRATWPTFAAHRITREVVGTAGNLLLIAQILLSVLMIAQVVQADSAVGTKAFWMTRPIPPGVLLRAKLTLLATAMIAPIVGGEAIVMAIYQVTLPDMLGVLAQTALFWSVWIALITAGAALTPNLPKLALLLGGTLAAIAVALLALFAVVMSRFAVAPPLAATDFAPYDPTSSTVTTALIGVAALVLLIAQYRTRCRVLSCTIGAIGLVVIYAVASAWRWPLLAPIVVTPAWAAGPAMLTLTANADSITLERSMWIRDQPIDWKEARAQIRMRGVEPGWTASVALREATVRVPGRSQLISSFAAYPAPVLAEEHGGQPQVREVIRRLLDVNTLVDEHPPEARGENAIIMFTRGSEIGRLAPAQGSYTGRFHVALNRHAIEAVLPFTPGATHQRGSYRVATRQIHVEPGHVFLLVDESNAISVFARRRRPLHSFYLRNRRLSQAILGSSFPLRTDIPLFAVLPFAIGFSGGEQPGFTIEAQAIDFPPETTRGAASILDEQWMSEAELVIVRSTEEGWVSRELAIADFPIR